MMQGPRLTQLDEILAKPLSPNTHNQEMINANHSKNKIDFLCFSIFFGALNAFVPSNEIGLGFGFMFGVFEAAAVVTAAHLVGRYGVTKSESYEDDWASRLSMRRCSAIISASTIYSHFLFPRAVSIVNTTEKIVRNFGSHLKL